MLQHHNTYSAKAWLKLSLFLLAFFTIGQFGIQPARAATWTICQSGNCDYSSIQAAINDSSDGDILQFKPENSISEKYFETITLNKSLTFLGQKTIIDTPNSGAAVIINGNPNVIIENIVILDDPVNGNDSAGIYLNGGNLTLTNVTLDNNDASTGFGGALYIANASSIVQLNDVTMTKNTAISGGAIYNNGTLTADNLTLADNTAIDGGGLYNEGTVIIKNQSALQRNIASQSGGGIFNAPGQSLTLDSSNLSNNEASDGAGIYNEGTLQITNTNVDNGNVATHNGGGLYNSGNVTLTNSTLVQNQANAGAGIYNEGALTANNSTFSRNTGPGNIYNANGPGLYNQSGTAILNNVTIHLTNGPSIFANGGTVEVGNTIISSSSEPACEGEGTFTSNGYNLANDQSCTFLTETGDLQGIEPNLNGIIRPAEGAAYHTPKLTSPVVDAGNPATPGSGGNACLASDQRGLARPQSQRCDIGAVEIVVYRLYMPSVTK